MSITRKPKPKAVKTKGRSASKPKPKASVLPPARQAVVDALETKLGPKSSANFEERIWKMCNQLGEEYVEDTNEIYGKYAYEKVGCILAAKDRDDRAKVLNDIKGTVLDWDSHNYDEFRRRRNLDNAQIAEGVKVEKGEFKCRKKECKSNECYFYLQQDRSGDEGMTTYVVCTKCSTRYRFN